MKKIIILIAIGALVVSLSFTAIHVNATASGTVGVGGECNVHAEDASHICQQGLVCVPKNNHSEGNGKCAATVTPTPTNEPTITPTLTPTPTDTPKGCEEDEDCVTPTPTPTISPTPSTEPTQVSSGGSGTPDASNPSCNGEVVDAPKLQGYKFNSPTSVTWNWWASTNTDIATQWIDYGYEKGNYPYSAFVDVHATSTDTNDLDPKQNMHWAVICVETQNACVACSAPFDPRYH